MTRDPSEDQEMWRRWVRGEDGAGRELARRMLPILRYFFSSKALAAEVDDLVQQVWLELAETVRRPRKVKIHTTVRAYLLGIPRHVLFRHIRRRVFADRQDPAFAPDGQRLYIIEASSGAEMTLRTIELEDAPDAGG